MSEEFALKRDEKGRLVKGTPPGPGRPEGSVGFEKIWKQAVDKIALEENITKDEAEVNLLVIAYKQAKRGNYPYFREIMDRKFGKPAGTAPETKILNVMPIFGGLSVQSDHSDEQDIQLDETD